MRRKWRESVIAEFSDCDYLADDNRPLVDEYSRGRGYQEDACLVSQNQLAKCGSSPVAMA
jgi:hypothetical protein